MFIDVSRVVVMVKNIKGNLFYNPAHISNFLSEGKSFLLSLLNILYLWD